MRVSVVGDFNLWDGRRHQMRKVGEGDASVFELFIPGLAAGCGYMYEIKRQGKGTTRKLDPVSRQISSVPITASVVSDENMPDSYNSI